MIINITIWHLLLCFPIVSIISAIMAFIWFYLEDKFKKKGKEFDPIKEANKILKK